MSVWTENIIPEFQQKILSGCLKIWKIRQGITFFCRNLYILKAYIWQQKPTEHELYTFNTILNYMVF